MRPGGLLGKQRNRLCSNTVGHRCQASKGKAGDDDMCQSRHLPSKRQNAVPGRMFSHCTSCTLRAEWDSDTPAIAPNQAAWLQRQLEDKMWRAADVQQLQRLGAAGSLLHYPYAAQQPKQGQQAAAASQRGGSTAASMLSTPPAGAAAALAEAAVAPALHSDAAARSLLGSGMQPESSSQAQAQAKAPGAGQQQQPGAGAGADAAAAGAPDWAACPLSLLHSVLLQAAGRLTVYSLLLTEARRLEKASWEGLLSIKRSTGTGLRFSYWPHQPLVVTHGELQALRHSGGASVGSAQGAAAAAPAGASAGASDAPGAAPALEVNLEEGGRLVCTHVPPLYSPLTNLPVELQLSPVSLSIEQLLLAAAAHNAATQLGGSPMGLSVR